MVDLTEMADLVEMVDLSQMVDLAGMIDLTEMMNLVEMIDMAQKNFKNVADRVLGLGKCLDDLRSLKKSFKNVSV